MTASRTCAEAGVGSRRFEANKLSILYCIAAFFTRVKASRSFRANGSTLGNILSDSSAPAKST